jgi:hypothetical protein
VRRLTHLIGKKQQSINITNITNITNNIHNILYIMNPNYMIICILAILIYMFFLSYGKSHAESAGVPNTYQHRTGRPASNFGTYGTAFSVESGPRATTLSPKTSLRGHDGVSPHVGGSPESLAITMVQQERNLQREIAGMNSPPPIAWLLWGNQSRDVGV